MIKKCPSCEESFCDNCEPGFEWYDEIYCSKLCAQESCFDGVNPSPTRKPPR